MQSAYDDGDDEHLHDLADKHGVLSCLPGNNEPLLCTVGQLHNVSGHAISLFLTRLMFVSTRLELD